MNQPTLFESNSETAQVEEILLFALGEFQKRGFELVDRELALDRLLGAVKRASEHFNKSELTDEEIAGNLEKLGANVKKVPSFVAKHPFRVTVNDKLAQRALEFFKRENEV
jgi:hypothetical protein